MADLQPQAAAQPSRPPAPPLGSAGASCDPRVHQLLAERIIAASDGADGNAAVAAIDQRLAALGVSVTQ